MDLKLPNLGEGADSGTVVNLFVKEGDQIAKDQPILELENEKAVATIPAAAPGRVTKIHVRTGDKISVGQSILSLSDGEGKQAPESGKPEAAPEPVSKDRPAPKPAEVEPEPQRTEELPPQALPGIAPAASPSIRKLASDLGIDLTRVRGSERGGRIVLADLRSYIERLQKQGAQPKPTSTAPAPAGKAAVEHIDFSKWGPVTRKRLSPLREVIARRMAESWTTVPHVTQFDEADITALNDLRKKYAPAYEKNETRLTLTSFALKVVVDMLKKHPLLHASLDEAAQELVLKDYFHLGVAVDTEGGLIVPVIRNVDKKNVLELSKELEALAKKARERKLTAEELKGGTFTISNQGGIGGGHFTPIINKPEVAILGLGRGTLRAIPREGKIEPRLILPLALSYDHRIIDGATAVRFIVDLVKAFENFNESDVKL